MSAYARHILLLISLDKLTSGFREVREKQVARASIARLFVCPVIAGKSCRRISVARGELICKATIAAQYELAVHFSVIIKLNCIIE
jgi:hypothetical protein